MFSIYSHHYVSLYFEDGDTQDNCSVNTNGHACNNGSALKNGTVDQGKGHDEYQYLNLVRKIIVSGSRKGDRTGKISISSYYTDYLPHLLFEVSVDVTLLPKFTFWSNFQHK